MSDKLLSYSTTLTPIFHLERPVIVACSRFYSDFYYFGSMSNQKCMEVECRNVRMSKILLNRDTTSI